MVVWTRAVVKFGYVLKVQQAGFADRLNMCWEKVIKGNSKASGLGSLKGGGPTY